MCRPRITDTAGGALRVTPARCVHPVEQQSDRVGHAGAHMQIGWADPATGLSFAYCTNGLDSDVMREAMRGLRLSDLAAGLTDLPG